MLIVIPSIRLTFYSKKKKIFVSALWWMNSVMVTLFLNYLKHSLAFLCCSFLLLTTQHIHWYHISTICQYTINWSSSILNVFWGNFPIEETRSLLWLTMTTGNTIFHFQSSKATFTYCHFPVSYNITMGNCVLHCWLTVSSGLWERRVTLLTVSVW